MKIVIKKPVSRAATTTKPAAPSATSVPAAPKVNPPKADPKSVPAKPLAKAVPAATPKVVLPKAAPKPTDAVARPPSKVQPIAPANLQSRFLAAYCGRLAGPLDILTDSVATLVTEGLDQDHTESLDTLYQSTQALRSMLDDLRDFAQLQTHSLKLQDVAVDCAAVLGDVREAYLPYAEAKGVALVCEPDRMPVLLLDGDRFRKVACSLVENAIRFTDKGTIGITLSHFGGKLKLTVEDTGCGMSPEKIATLFDPYVRLQSDLSGEGPGLGMALVRGIAEQMGGGVEVSSAPGIGTSITVTMPNIRAAHSREVRGFTSQRIQAIKLALPTRRDSKILVVDDSPVNLAFMRGMFRAMEFTHVETASSGIEALEKVLAGNVEIVFTDIVMPGMNGMDLVREIRRVPAYANLPVYAVTADNEARESFAAAGFTEVLLKPMTRDKIRRLIG